MPQEGGAETADDIGETKRTRPEKKMRETVDRGFPPSPSIPKPPYRHSAIPLSPLAVERVDSLSHLLRTGGRETRSLIDRAASSARWVPCSDSRLRTTTASAGSCRLRRRLRPNLRSSDCQLWRPGWTAPREERRAGCRPAKGSPFRPIEAARRRLSTWHSRPSQSTCAPARRSTSLGQCLSAVRRKRNGEWAPSRMHASALTKTEVGGAGRTLSLLARRFFWAGTLPYFWKSSFSCSENDCVCAADGSAI